MLTGLYCHYFHILIGINLTNGYWDFFLKIENEKNKGKIKELIELSFKIKI